MLLPWIEKNSLPFGFLVGQLVSMLPLARHLPRRRLHGHAPGTIRQARPMGRHGPACYVPLEQNKMHFDASQCCTLHCNMFIKCIKMLMLKGYGVTRKK